MIAQIFNSSLISGPETLVLPNLHYLSRPYCVIWLKEERRSEAENKKVFDYFSSYAKVYTIPVRKRWDKKAAQELHQLLIQLNVRYAHAHDVKASWILAQTPVPASYRKISTHHGVHARSGFQIRLYEQYYSRFVLPQMDLVLCLCESDFQILLSRGIKKNKLKIHYNGVDRPLVTPEARLELQKNIRQKWQIDISADEKIYGIIARLAHEKDHEKALLVLQQYLRIANQKIKILCFGTGPLQESLIRKTKELGLEEIVLWMGYRSTVGSELAGFDGLLSFSQAEGLPINLIEAAWALTPIFARQVDGVADLIPKSQYGVSFPASLPNHEIAKLLAEFATKDHSTQALAMQQRVIDQFSGKKWVSRLEELLQTFDDPSETR